MTVRWQGLRGQAKWRCSRAGLARCVQAWTGATHGREDVPADQATRVYGRELRVQAVARGLCSAARTGVGGRLVLRLCVAVVRSREGGS